MTPSMSCCLPINVVSPRGCTDIDEKVERLEQKTNAHTPYILALDVGTSSTRALLFDANGAEVPGILAQESYELTLSNDGEASVDADTLVAAVASTIDQALEAAGPLTSSIGAVATDTFWHSLVGVDTDRLVEPGELEDLPVVIAQPVRGERLMLSVGANQEGHQHADAAAVHVLKVAEVQHEPAGPLP